MITVKVSDLLKMAQEISADGIKYVDITELEADGNIPKTLNFNGHNLDEFSMKDYEEIEEVDLSSYKK